MMTKENKKKVFVKIYCNRKEAELGWKREAIENALGEIFGRDGYKRIFIDALMPIGFSDGREFMIESSQKLSQKKKNILIETLIKNFSSEKNQIDFWE